MLLTLVMAESSIELAPNEIVGHPAITSSARKKGKEPHEIILDQSYHHSAILRMAAKGIGRGRPDIAHFSLLQALGSPLNLDGQLRCFVHTRDDRVIKVNPKARLPRNTDRFTSLLEQLYEQSVVPASGDPLLSMNHQTLASLLKELSSDHTVALTTQGVDKDMEVVATELAKSKRPVILVGGFPTGHFSTKAIDNSNAKYRIDKRELEAWTVVGRAVYDFERIIRMSRF